MTVGTNITCRKFIQLKADHTPTTAHFQLTKMSPPKKRVGRWIGQDAYYNRGRSFDMSIMFISIASSSSQGECHRQGTKVREVMETRLYGYLPKESTPGSRSRRLICSLFITLLDETKIKRIKNEMKGDAVDIPVRTGYISQEWHQRKEGTSREIDHPKIYEKEQRVV